MKRILKYFFTFILVCCGLLIIGSALLHFADLDPFRERIANIATRAIGRQVEINGHIDVRLFPHPEVILNDVSFANAEWGSEPTMISVGHFDASIGFLSLYSDMPIVRSVRLNDVTILFEQDDQKNGNWELETISSSANIKEDKAGQDTDIVVALPLIVDFIELSNISITVRAPGSNDQVCHFLSLALQPDKSGDLILEASGKLSGNPMVMNGRITSKTSIAAHGPVNVELQASFGDTQLNGRLSTSRLATLSDLQGSLNFDIKDIQNLLSKIGIKAPFDGPFTAEAVFNHDCVNGEKGVSRVTVTARLKDITTTVAGSYADKKLDLSSTVAPLSLVGELFDLQGLSAETLKLEARIAMPDANDFEVEQFYAHAGKNSLTAQGRITRDGDANLSLTLVSPDLSTILDALPAIDLNAKAFVRNSTEKITISDMSATFDKSDINGDITVIKGDTQAINAGLTSKLFDLRPFNEITKPGNDATQMSSMGAAKKPDEKKSKTGSRYVFKKEPLPFALLKGVETDVELSVDHFYHDLGELKDIKINAAVHNGHVDVKFKCTSPDEGHAAGKIDLKIQDQKAIVDTVLSLSDFRLSVLKSEGISPAEVPPMSVSIELKSDGSSPRELAAAANGTILITQGAGKINNNMMKMFANDIIMQLASALNPFSQNEEFSKWDCTVISVNIVDGLADINGLLAQGEKVMIVGGGDIDLKTEALNVEFNTKPRSGVGISADMFVAPFIKVTGTLANPGIGLNKKGTLLTGGAAIATGGLSLVLQRAIDRAKAEGDHCEEILKIAGEHTCFSF